MTWLVIFHEAFYGGEPLTHMDRDLFHLLFERVYFEPTLRVPSFLRVAFLLDLSTVYYRNLPA